MQPTATNAAAAAKILFANLTPRARELLTLERYIDGTQYDGKPDWFDDSVPLWHRAPCIVYPIGATAIRSNVDLVLGEGRFPVITSNPGEDDSESEGLDEDQSKKVDRALEELQKRSRFHAAMRQALERAQGEKSVALLFGARAGIPFVETVKARWCTPTFDVEGNVTRLEVRYPYLQWEKQPDGSWLAKVNLYRRVIDAAGDTTFLPLPADPGGREPPDDRWQIDTARTVAAHGLGFCPVRWYAHMKECSSVSDFDGVAVHQNLLDEIRGLDFVLSMRHRAVLYCGDPQIIEVGVTPGSNPSSGSGQSGAMPSTVHGGTANGDNPVVGAYHDASGGRSARIKSPGVVWQYEDPNVKVTLLTLGAEAITAIDEHAADLRNKIAESLAVVILDPENVKMSAAMSGKAIEALRTRQFDRCDQYRDDVEHALIMPSLLMLLRVALKTAARIPAIKAVSDILAKYAANDDAAPMLFLRWPTGYTKPAADDEQMTIAAVTTAFTGGVITKRMALQKLSSIFGIDNVDQALEQLEAEAEESQANALEQAKAQLDMKGAADGGQPPNESEPT